MNNNDREKQENEAKQRARAEAQAAAAAREAGNVGASGEPPRLDERYEQKGNNSMQQQGNVALNNSTTESRLEMEANAKQRARLGVSGESKPGAVSVASASVSANMKDGAARSQLESLEDSIAAKTRGIDSSSSRINSNSAASALAALEDRVTAKLKQNDGKMLVSGPPSHADASSTPQSALQSLEDRVFAKIRRDTAGSSNLGGSARAELSNLEDSVAAKAASFAAATGVARAPPQQHSDDYDYDEMARFEERIAAKNNIPYAAGASHEYEDIADRKLPANHMAENYEEDEREMHPPDSMMEHNYPGDADMNIKRGVPMDEPEKAPEKAGFDQDGDAGDYNGYDRPPRGGNTLFDDSDLEYAEYDPENTEGLAVAIPVMEEEEDVFIPSAVEYDPDAKPPALRSGRTRLYTLLGIFVFVVVVVGIGVGVAVGSDQKSLTKAELRAKLGLQERLELVIDREMFNVSSSPYSKALRWITYFDPMELVPDDPNLFQRYLLAYFYYATTESGPWHTCNPPNVSLGEDYSCMYEKYLSDTPTITRVPIAGSVRWLSEQPECLWVGIMCDSLGHIRSIDLHAQNMTGSFPDGIAYFPYLQMIHFGFGQLQGTIPSKLAAMKYLTEIEFQYNYLSGVIPEEIYESRSIQRFQAAGNKFTGSISTKIGNLQSLKGIHFYENLLNGTIPTEMGAMKNLAFIWGQRNMLTGTLPTELGNLKRVNTIWLFENNLIGTIPTEYGRPPLLTDYRMQNNEQLTGKIPDELYKPDVFRIDLFNCNLTGTISSLMGQMTGLAYFQVQNNRFSGALPTNMEGLTALSTLVLSGNDFTGTVPPALCMLRTEFVLKDLEADCLVAEEGSDLYGQPPELNCPEGCCTRCCDKSGETCVNEFTRVL